MNMKDQLMMQARYSRGDFGNPDAGKADFSREGIMAMSKDGLCEMLEVHGIDADKRKGRATLASELIDVMFMEAGE